MEENISSSVVGVTVPADGLSIAAHTDLPTTTINDIQHVEQEGVSYLPQDQTQQPGIEHTQVGITSEEVDRNDVCAASCFPTNCSCLAVTTMAAKLRCLGCNSYKYQ
jgi:hypothetical protein